MLRCFKDFYRGKKVFITGHTGFKGSWLATWLLELGAEVAGYSNGIPTTPSHYELLNLKGLIKEYIEDIRDVEALTAAIRDFQPDLVFHLAAQPIVGTAHANPRETFDINIMGMVNILEAIKTTTCPATVILVTSDKCYENVEWEFGYRESDRLGGKDPYSASKGAAEIVASSYIRTYFSGTTSHNAKLATARAGNVIGGGDWAAGRLVPDCVKAWGSSQTLTIRSQNSTRPWQHVLEPLSGYLHLAVLLHEGNKRLVDYSFNFGPPVASNVSVGELLRESSKYWDFHEIETIPLAEQQKSIESRLLQLCCDRAHSQLSWSPVLDFAQTIAFTMQWYRDYYHKQQYNIRDLTRNQIHTYCTLAQQKGISWAHESTAQT